MFCPKCGDYIEKNEKFCNKCGNCLIQNTNNLSNQNNVQININKDTSFFTKNKNNILGLFVGILIGGIVLVIFALIFKEKNYYFSSNSYNEEDEIVENNNTASQQNTTKKKGKYETVIIADKKYTGVSISNETDAYNLISKDSTSQKENCPLEIQQIENDIIEKYNITAVNLCELDLDFAKEIENVIDTIYSEYPDAKKYLTNLSLINCTLTNNYIAAFMPIFYFATSNTKSGYPWVIKTQILLNTSFYLNKEKLETSVVSSSKAGHFPPNATIYSPVAHEFGHYLSYIAMMKYYNLNSILLVDENNAADIYKISSDFQKGDFSLKMIEDAYNNYKKDYNTTLSIDEWRGTISQYALAKDNSGDYIYDETIAEAFHDVYLNGDNAKDASKYVVMVLKSRLGGTK